MKNRLAVLFLLFTSLHALAQEVRRGDCTPQVNPSGTALARGAKPLRLPSIYNSWDSTRVYRQAVILLSFADTDFAVENPREFYDKVFNRSGFNWRNGPGCVAEYFREQSRGMFNVVFDVYGPIKVKGKAQPYANPTGDTRNYGHSSFTEAVNKAIDSLKVDFTPYDWNDNGSVNQIIFVYAGACGNQDAKTSYGHIWPNTGTISTINANGKRISNYTASAETWNNGASCGIGTIIHEYTHSLGLPDIYPTVSSGGYSVMDEWDLMDGGNFTNYGWCPPNYTPLEKMLLGWLTPVELTEAQSVKNMKPLAEGGVVYRIKHSNNEWLLLENRQQKGWDLGLPGKGLLIYHVYYDRSLWSANIVNNDVNKRRFSLFNADNMDYDAWYDYLFTWAKPKQYAGSDHMNSHLLSTSAYPWTTDSTEFVNDKLTNTSIPAARMFSTNIDGETMLGMSVTNIVQNPDGTVSFDFAPDTQQQLKGDVNADGAVNVADISAIISIMAGDQGSSQESGSAAYDADVNEDGAVNVADISAVITIMAEQ